MAPGIHSPLSSSDKVKFMHDITSDTPCSFTREPDDQDSSELANLVTGPGVGMDEDLSIELIENTTTHDVVKFWPWVNLVGFHPLRFLSRVTETLLQTPLSVSPELPLEIVMQLFKRMGYGPRKFLSPLFILTIG